MRKWLQIIPCHHWNCFDWRQHQINIKPKLSPYKLVLGDDDVQMLDLSIEFCPHYFA